MPITAAAVVPHPPLLLPELGRGPWPDLEELRSASRQALATLLDQVDALLVVGPAPTWGEADPGATASFLPWGAPVTARLPAPRSAAGEAPPPAPPGSSPPAPAAPPAPPGSSLSAPPAPAALPALPAPAAPAAPAASPGSGAGGASTFGSGGWLDRGALPPGRLAELPLSLAVAAWLLNQAATERELPPVVAFGVPAGAGPGEAAALGRALAAVVRPAIPVGLLVMADLSARRTQRAPASFHPGAEEFDRRIGDAVRKAELGRLLDVDPGLAAEMGAGGMAALWLLAGALGSAPEPHGEVRYEGGPFGVGYLVGVVEAR
jgi:hypothetical protein